MNVYNCVYCVDYFYVIKHPLCFMPALLFVYSLTLSTVVRLELGVFITYADA